MIFLQILRLLAVMVLAFGAGKLASKLKMPVILGWLIAGMVLGPHALNLLDQQTLDAAWFGSVEHLLECVAGLIIGTELLWKKLRSAGRQILVTTVTESLGTFAVVSLVFACVFRITGVPVYLAFLFGGIVLATAPAPSLSIVNELKTNGPVTRTLMPMAALDDLVGATVFFVVVALVSAQISSVGIPVAGMRDEGLLRFDKSRFELLVEMPITEDEPDPKRPGIKKAALLRGLLFSVRRLPALLCGRKWIPPAEPARKHSGKYPTRRSARTSWQADWSRARYPESH